MFGTEDAVVSVFGWVGRALTCHSLIGPSVNIMIRKLKCIVALLWR